jgi:hypothetical protein
LKKQLIPFLFFLVSCSFYGQVLQRQMISAQGGVYQTNGLVFSQSVGQLSVNGTASTKTHTFQQGFQQSFFAMAQNQIPLLNFTFSIYPNPVVDSFTLTVSNVVEESCTITIFTVLGQQVYQGQLASFQSQKIIPFGTYSNGTYLVQLVSGKQIVTKKIIKI